jgi:hypothetical protein
MSAAKNKKRKHSKAKKNNEEKAIAATKKKKLPYEWKRINYFFKLLDKKGPEEELWKMLKLALTCDNDNADEHDRSNMIFFYEYAKELFENIYTLLQQQQKEKRLKNKP